MRLSSGCDAAIYVPAYGAPRKQIGRREKEIAEIMLKLISKIYDKVWKIFLSLAAFPAMILVWFILIIVLLTVTSFLTKFLDVLYPFSLDRHLEQALLVSLPPFLLLAIFLFMLSLFLVARILNEAIKQVNESVKQVEETQARGLQYMCDRLAEVCDNMEEKKEKLRQLMHCKCPHCGTKYEFEAEDLGQSVSCQGCGRTFTLKEGPSRIPVPGQ